MFPTQFSIVCTSAMDSQRKRFYNLAGSMFRDDFIKGMSRLNQEGLRAMSRSEEGKKR